ncbi:hypothetical protein [Pyxidicoccus xibeiensis]|uniref:hypothetical protein n=1 Tax=Pyxidicoccus xibeiensis TaxID=2906759 RepID=UPI0020A7F856|nr:hypothetical protein [Pyxidicoccus xibeiensis]MCP3136324.1 hypothetical protein [Pyxidicoccus xibeiensis]
MQLLSPVLRVAALTFGLALAAIPDTAAAQSCVDNCGSSAGTCYCDASCSEYGDCCSDFQSACGDSSSASLTSSCSAVCNSSSDCGYECADNYGNTSWCGHFTCYIPEETRDAPCASFCDSTSDCNAQCISDSGAAATCSAYVCNAIPPPNFDIHATTTEPCTESGSGSTYTITCAKNTGTQNLGNSALGMKGWSYYSSRVAIDTANAQLGARARFLIVGKEIGSYSNPALDVYSNVQPVARACKTNQAGIYIRAGGSIVWKKAINKSCVPAQNLTDLPGLTCPETLLDFQGATTPVVIYNQTIPGASKSFSYTIKVVTATLSASAKAKVQYTASHNLTTRNASSTVDSEVIGSVVGGAKVDVSAFNVGAEVGINGTANLLDYHMPNIMEVSSTNGSNLTVHSNAYVQRKAASWTLEAYLTAKFFIGHKTWKHKIGSGTWGGDGAPATLFERYWYPSFAGLTPISCTALKTNYDTLWPSCGDGVCNGGETSCLCNEDCGGTCTIVRCGDGRCSLGENCPVDCNGGGTCRMPPCPVL